MKVLRLNGSYHRAQQNNSHSPPSYTHSASASYRNTYMASTATQRIHCTQYPVTHVQCVKQQAITKWHLIPSNIHTLLTQITCILSYNATNSPTNARVLLAPNHKLKRLENKYKIDTQCKKLFTVSQSANQFPKPIQQNLMGLHTTQGNRSFSILFQRMLQNLMNKHPAGIILLSSQNFCLSRL